MKNNVDLENLLGLPSYVFEKFHAKTKFKKLGKNTDPKFWPKEWKKVYYKGYARLPEIKLPKPSLLNNKSLGKALINRISTRKFSNKKLSLQELSTLLYCSAGISPNKTNIIARRFYPSPGGRYPLEVYILPLNASLPVSFYHYYVRNNSLEQLFEFNKKNLGKVTNAPFAKKASVLVIITAVFKRNTIKYGERGYRHVLVEAGHLAQNFYLVSTALDLGICGIGGYVDDNINNFLDIDGVNESVVYVLAVGNKKK